jgi:hypothetical protein
MTWRKKVMSLSEWTAFEKRVAEFQMMLRDHPDLAMFCRGDSSDDREIYITGLYIHAIEDASPGGWEDCDRPAGGALSLLVGTSEAWGRLGVQRPTSTNR